jgi:hypothetical protein
MPNALAIFLNEFMAQLLQLKDTRQAAGFDPSKGTFRGVFNWLKAARIIIKLEQIVGLIYTGITRFFGTA